MSKGKSEAPPAKAPATLVAHQEVPNAVQSFCARVINLCFDVEGASTLSHFQSLSENAARLRQEAEGIQDIYGGRWKGKPK